MAPEMDKTPLSLEGKSIPIPSNSSPKRSIVFVAQVCLRSLAIVLTLASISLTLTDKQTISIFGLQFKARYSYSSAFRFLVGADSVLCVSSLLSLIFLFNLLKRSEPNSLQTKLFLLFVHDTVMMVLVVSGCAAATAIGYVGRRGEAHMTWQAVCEQVPKFCNRMMVAVMLSYLAFLAYFTLTLLSAHRLMTRPTHWTVWTQLRPTTQSQNPSD